MSLPDSFYLALCMTILLVGAVYWVWTQIQYVQRKVNALENIVYELKTLCSTARQQQETVPLAPVSYPPAPPSEMGEEDADLLEETLRNEIEEETLDAIPSMPDRHIDAGEEEPFQSEENTMEMEMTPHPLMMVQDELQTGGSANSVVAPSFSSSLDSMSVKELRRLATQKGVSGAADMKKKDLITAIRSIPMESFLE